MFPNIIVAVNNDNMSTMAFGPYNEEDTSMLIKSMQQEGHYDPILWIDLGTNSTFVVQGNKTIQSGNYLVALRDFSGALDQIAQDFDKYVDKHFAYEATRSAWARGFLKGYHEAISAMRIQIKEVQAKLSKQYYDGKS